MVRRAASAQSRNHVNCAQNPFTSRFAEADWPVCLFKMSRIHDLRILSSVVER